MQQLPVTRRIDRRANPRESRDDDCSIDQLRGGGCRQSLPGMPKRYTTHERQGHDAQRNPNRMAIS